MLYFSVSANFWNFFKRISFSPSQNISMTDFCLIDTFLTFWTQCVSPRTLCENSKKIIINLLCQSSPYFVKSILEIPLQKAIFFSKFHISMERHLRRNFYTLPSNSVTLNQMLLLCGEHATNCIRYL